MSAASRGKPKSPEHRAKLSAALIGNTRNLGKPQTAEHRARISAANRGRPKSPEHRAKISARRRASELDYKAAHTRFQREWPKRGCCEHCGGVGRTEWCWLRQAEEPGGWSLERADYCELCTTCHRRLDRLVEQDSARGLDELGCP